MKSSPLSVEEILNFFGQVKADASIAVVTNPNNGKKYAVKSTTDYLSGFLTQAQTDNGEILMSANTPVIGLRSLKGNQLPEGTYKVAYAVRTLFAALGASTDAALIAAPWTTNAPVQFKNGEVKINQTGDLFKSSGTDCTNFKASTGNDDDFRSIVPVVLRPQTDISINFKLAGAATANDAYKFEIRSMEFVAIGKQ